MKFFNLEKIKEIGGAFLLAVLMTILLGGAAYAATTVVCHGSAATVQYHLQDCYKAPGTTTGNTPIRVTEYGDDLCVKNGNPPDLLVPTNSPLEWTKFKAVTASTIIGSSIHVSLGACDTTNPGSGGGTGAWGYGYSCGHGGGTIGTFNDATGAAVSHLRANIAQHYSSAVATQLSSRTAQITWPNYQHGQYGPLTSLIQYDPNDPSKGNITSTTLIDNAPGGGSNECANSDGYSVEVQWDYSS